MQPSEMTTLQLLEAAASELYNCEAVSDENADLQLDLGRELRKRAEVLRGMLDELNASDRWDMGLGPRGQATFAALKALNAPIPPDRAEGET